MALNEWRLNEVGKERSKISFRCKERKQRMERKRERKKESIDK